MSYRQRTTFLYNSLTFQDPKNVVQSMVRGCENKPIYTNQVIEDSTFRTYYRACKQDLCNDGSAKSSVSTSTGNKSGYNNLLVPGVGSSNQKRPQTYIIIILLMVSTAMLIQ